MNDTKMILSPGFLYTDYGRYRLLQTEHIHRDDYPYKAYNTFLVTPEDASADAHKVHVPGYALTVGDRFQVVWHPTWIELALPIEDDPEFRLYVEDVVTDQEPVVAMPDYYPENDPDGYSCCGDEGV